MNKYTLEQALDNLSNLPIFIRNENGDLFEIKELSTVFTEDKGDNHIAIVIGE